MGGLLWEIIVIILGVFEAVFVILFVEHYTKFRPGLAEKFMLRKDCSNQMEIRKQEISRLDSNILQIHTENREDHRQIYDELRKMNKEFNDQFVSIVKCLNKLNGSKEGNA